MEVNRVFLRQFAVEQNRVFSKSAKSGRKVGKPLAELEVIRRLSELDIEFSKMPLVEQSQHLAVLIREAGREDADDITMDCIDEAMAPLMQAFLWHSTGTSIQVYFWSKYLERFLAGHENPKGAPKEIALSPGGPDGLAIALQADGKLWAQASYWYEELVYSGAALTPKKVADGRKIMHSLRGYLIQAQPTWLSDSRFRLDVAPKTISNQNDEWCFLRFLLGKVIAYAPDAQPTPTWDQWLCKLGAEPFRKVFKAWLFSVFVAGNTGRQILWIEDAGGGGKGTIANVIQRYMRYVGCGAMDSHMLTDGFGAASAYGKRLLIHPDNKNPRLLSSGLIHQITGGDQVRVNDKFEKAFTAKMDAKVMVLANCRPEVDMHLLHESSRLIYLLLDPNAAGADRSHRVVQNGEVQLVGDSDFPNRLFAEMSDFLAGCHKEYVELCPKGANIKLPAEVVEAAQISCSSAEADSFEHMADEGMLFGADYYLPRHSLATFVKDLKTPGGNFALSSMKKYLESRGCRDFRLPDAKRSKVYLGCTLKSEIMRLADVGRDEPETDLPF